MSMHSISKYFRESLGIQDNESRLYIYFSYFSMQPYVVSLRNCSEGVFGDNYGIIFSSSPQKHVVDTHKKHLHEALIMSITMYLFMQK